MKTALWLLTGCAVCLQADVFWRRPADFPGTWQQAYSSPFESQGHEGTMTIYGTADSLDQIGAGLLDRHGDALVWMPGDVMAWALAIEGRRLYRYLVQPRPTGDHWIACFESNARTAPEPGTPNVSHQLRDLPAPAGGTPTFYSHDVGNKASVEISEVAASPEGALISLSQQLETAGWAPSLLNTGGFRMFAKGNHVAFLGAHQGKDGRTRVLRLHKPLGVK